jgi:hypothetical protein
MTAPATDAAIIIYANTHGAHCGTCETLKLSVAPSGQVLVERGYWGAGHNNWRYKRSVAQVGPDRAAAFAASLSGDRPAGAQVLASSVACPVPAADNDGLVIEWIEAERHDLLTLKFGCPAGRNSELAARLRHAPDLLGLRELAFP